ncbi:PREDICTED: LOW QUALITY PROTEIN: RING finger protein 39 [Mandrillus leucophaeus]|uniref:LOW QUALITY PROTEIN: RING finger protein 39 n=1 Tax=Mandrillus leucophaeus TaxID=9568 RepID=UPI0005F45AA5|nr:PREDICTED: LOW QUALITY PROTEIN: RING finger protein 39 [Mandrillus leucophaeus]
MSWRDLPRLRLWLKTEAIPGEGRKAAKVNAGVGEKGIYTASREEAGRMPEPCERGWREDSGEAEKGYRIERAEPWSRREGHGNCTSFGRAAAGAREEKSWRRGGRGRRKPQAGAAMGGGEVRENGRRGLWLLSTSQSYHPSTPAPLLGPGSLATNQPITLPDPRAYEVPTPKSSKSEDDLPEDYPVVKNMLHRLTAFLLSGSQNLLFPTAATVLPDFSHSNHSACNGEQALPISNGKVTMFPT